MSEKKPTFCAFIDFQKAFDCVDRDMLFYKLRVLNGITGPMFDAIRSIYSHSAAMVRVNNEVTNPFSFSSDVKQGYNLSPTLFSMYINDIAIGVKGMNCGIDIGGPNFSILVYADDIVIMAPDEKKLHDMFYIWMASGKCLSTKEKPKLYISARKDISVLILNGSLEMLSWKQKKALGQLRYKLRFLK